MAITVTPPAECKECGSPHLTWQSTIISRTDVQQGRLNTHDVECLFFLGCDECSETLMTISADKVADLMNANAAVSVAPLLTQREPTPASAVGTLVHRATD